MLDSPTYLPMTLSPTMLSLNNIADDCGKYNGEFCAKYSDPPSWIFIIKAFFSLLIIAENFVVLIAILRNWKTLMRQHNLYRYVLSLVSADLLSGIILLLHALFWIIRSYQADVDDINNENFQEVLRNFITGILHGLTFAALASSALLNLVLRITSTRALARAAAIQPQNQFCLSWISWVRSPRISIGIIGLMWSITAAFITLPLAYHCHMDVCQCFNQTVSKDGYFVKVKDKRILYEDDPAVYDCSILRTPIRRSYLVVLNSFITFTWCIMLICNILTICIKTEVRKNPTVVEGQNNLKLHHSFGITRDSSSFFAFIITTSLTISTIPFVVFTFITETGSPYERIYFGREISATVVEVIELSTYFCSAMNPIIYTAILSRLRSEVSRLLGGRQHFKAYEIQKLKAQINEELYLHKEENGNFV